MVWHSLVSYLSDLDFLILGLSFRGVEGWKGVLKGVMNAAGFSFLVAEVYGRVFLELVLGMLGLGGVTEGEVLRLDVSRNFS